MYVRSPRSDQSEFHDRRVVEELVLADDERADGKAALVREDELDAAGVRGQVEAAHGIDRLSRSDPHVERNGELRRIGIEAPVAGVGQVDRGAVLPLVHALGAAGDAQRHRQDWPEAGR